jgi:hypothetical protein
MHSILSPEGSIFNIIKNYVVGNNIEESVDTGDLQTLQIYHVMTNPKCEEYTKNGNCLLYYICNKGYIKTAEWLINECKINKDGCISYPYNSFESACSGGNLDMVKWLDIKFNIVESDWIGYFGNICRKAPVHIVEWLLNNKEIPIDNCIGICSLNRQGGFEQACLGNKIDTVKLLVARFNLTREDCLYRSGSAYKFAIENNSKQVIEWFKKEINPAEHEYAEDSDYYIQYWAD